MFSLAPQTESPIEDLFLEAMNKRISETARLTPQVEVRTLCGTFRLDFLLEAGGKRIAVECDGHDYHDEERDEWRDAMIVGDQCVDEIFRFRGRDLVWRTDDCLLILRHFHPALFSERGVHIVERLGSQEARDQLADGFGVAEGIRIFYRGERGGSDLMFYAWHRHGLGDAPNPWWRFIYRYAVANGGGRLDDVIAKFRDSAPFL